MAVRQPDDCHRPSKSPLIVGDKSLSAFAGTEFKPYEWKAFVRTERHMRNLDDIEISDTHHYGDLGIRWSFHEMLRPKRIPMTYYWEMPSQIGMFHDESNPFYKRLVGIQQKMVRTSSLDYGKTMLYIRDLFLAGCGWAYENMTTVFMAFVGVMIFMMMYFGYTEQVQIAQQSYTQSVNVQHQLQQAQVNLQVATIKQQMTDQNLSTSVAMNTELQKQMSGMVEQQRLLMEQVKQLSAANDELYSSIKAKKSRLSKHASIHRSGG